MVRLLPARKEKKVYEGFGREIGKTFLERNNALLRQDCSEHITRNSE